MEMGEGGRFHGGKDKRLKDEPQDP
jgi:hypothetical protein